MKYSAIVLAAALAIGLAGCETATPYQAAAPNAPGAAGFTDQQIDTTHFRVTFQGNSVTPRDRVENYLLFRAAELTVKQGFDWFEMADRKTDNHQETFTGPQPYGWYWHPSWRFYGGRHGFRGGFGFGWGDSFWDDDYDVQALDRFDAQAEIAVGHGPKPADDPKAFDAHEVMTHLGPTIVRPS